MSAPLSHRASTSGPGEQPAGDDRRQFLVKAAAAVTGGVAGAVPLASGLCVFFDPLRRSSDNTSSVRIATLDSVPDDGIPRRFPVVADMTNAWNRYPNEPVGAVFLRRLKGQREVVALHATCPHAGCSVDYHIGAGQFKCPCHNSFFQPDGARLDPETCPSPRDLDTLNVDAAKLAAGEVWIEFQNFRAATPERIAE